MIVSAVPCRCAGDDDEDKDGEGPLTVDSWRVFDILSVAWIVINHKVWLLHLSPLGLMHDVVPCCWLRIRIRNWLCVLVQYVLCRLVRWARRAVGAKTAADRRALRREAVARLRRELSSRLRARSTAHVPVRTIHF